MANIPSCNLNVHVIISGGLPIHFLNSFCFCDVVTWCCLCLTSRVFGFEKAFLEASLIDFNVLRFISFIFPCLELLKWSDLAFHSIYSKIAKIKLSFPSNTSPHALMPCGVPDRFEHQHHSGSPLPNRQ